MKGGSYQQEKSVFINLNDMDLYGLLKRTDAYIPVTGKWSMPTSLSYRGSRHMHSI